MTMQLLNGDCLEKLKELETNSIDSLVTDPPAGIAFMGKDWDKDKGGRDGWIEWMAEVMAESLRVLKPGAHGLVWAIPRTSHWTATACENAGFEIRDVVTHLFGSGFPKSHNISKAIDKIAGVKGETYIDKEFQRRNPGTKLDGIDRKKEYSGTEFKEGVLGATRNKPATDNAKKWDGYGTATKPAVENWLLVAKPFTTVSLDPIISDLNRYIREFVCQQLHAKYANQILNVNHPDLGAQRLDFVQWLAVVLNTPKREDLSGEMGMFKSPETERIYLSIALLWSRILDALLNIESKSIIKMETDLITELRILNCSILPIIQDNTTKEGMSLSGSQLNAITVQSNLKSANLRLSALMEVIAPGDASIQAANFQMQQSKTPDHAPEISRDVLSEHWILVRKPLEKKHTIAQNVLKHGCGGINIDGCRVDGTPRNTGYKNPGSLVENPGEWNKRYSGIRRETDQTKGRFPANLVLSGDAPEALDKQSGISTSPTGFSKRSASDNVAMSGGNTERISKNGHGDKGGASRFFYCAKASKKDRNEGLEHLPEKTAPLGDDRPSGQSMSRLDGRPQRTNQNTHPTVKPFDLMKYFCRLVTPQGGTVLDPFMGSGSTGKAAKAEGFGFVGIEQDAEYFEIAKTRLLNEN